MSIASEKEWGRMEGNENGQRDLRDLGQWYSGILKIVGCSA